MNIAESRSTNLGITGNPFSVTNEKNTQTINSRKYTSTFTGSNHTWVNTFVLTFTSLLKTVGPYAAVGAWLGAWAGQSQGGALVGVACAAASGFGVALGQGYEKSFYDRHPECKDNHKCDALQDPHMLGGGHSF